MNWVTLVAIIVTIIVLYIIGTIITFPFVEDNKDSFFCTFVRLLVGFLAVTTAYAIVKTEGNTVLFVIFVIGFAYLFHAKKKISLTVNKFQSVFLKRAYWYNLMVVIVLSFSFFLYFLFLSSKTSVYYIPHFDDVYYTFLSTKLGYFGLETGASVYDGSWHNATPYHYVELWFLNLLVSVFKMNPMFTYAVVERTIGCTMLAVGMIVVTRQYSKNKWLIILGIFSITICPFLLDYSVIEQKQCLAYRPLGMFMYCLYIWSCVLFLKKNSFWFYPLLAAPIFHMGSMPVLYSSIVTIAFMQALVYKSIKTFMHKIVPTLGMVIVFICFYLFFNSLPSVKADVDKSNILDYCLQFYSLSRFGKHLYANLANCAMFFIYIVPLFLLFVYNFIKNKTWISEFWNEYKGIFIFFCISMCFGLVYGYFSYPFFRYDADQLHTLVNVPFLCILSFLSILIAITNIRNIKISYIALFYALCCLTYSTTIYYISRIRTSYVPEDCYDSVYITNVADYYNTKCKTFRGGQISSDAPVFSLEVPNGYLFMPFCLQTKFMYFTNLNTYFPNDSIMYVEIEKMYGDSDLGKFFKRNYPSQLKQDPFARFAKQYVDSCGETSVDVLRFEFIKKYRLGFIVCDSKSDIPDVINNLVDTVFIDSKTGERFVFLNNN